MKSLTVRLEARQARALAEVSRETGRPVSAIVREALEIALVLAPETIAVRAGHVRGDSGCRCAGPPGERFSAPVTCVPEARPIARRSFRMLPSPGPVAL